MRYEIPMKSLALVIHAAGKKDVRYYLNGVHVSGPLCTATDGHIMLRRRDDAQVAPAPLLLPRAAVEWALKTGKGAETLTVTRGDGFGLTAAVASQTLACEEIDGRYPDCDAIIPIGDYKCEPVGFAGEYLIAFAKAAKAAGDRWSAVRIEPAGDRAARVDFPNLPGCGGVAMPQRMTVGRASVPVA